MRLVVTACLAVLATLVGRSPAADPPRLLVPAYFYPGGGGLTAWKTLLDSSSKAPVVSIVNPDSGPGKKVDDNYTALFERAKASKATLIGYVTLSYAKRPLSAVKADVDSWVHFYPGVRGIFFDEQASGAKEAAFALEAFAYARSKIEGAVVVTNPGTPCAPEYLAPKDSLTACLFEGPGGFDKYTPPAWTDRLPADRFAVLTYGVKSADEMRAALRDAAKKRAGYVYVTDAAGENPWDRLPTYWADEVAAAASK